jgi:hypothetical protein
MSHFLQPKIILVHPWRRSREGFALSLLLLVPPQSHCSLLSLSLALFVLCIRNQPSSTSSTRTNKSAPFMGEHLRPLPSFPFCSPTSHNSVPTNDSYMGYYHLPTAPITPQFDATYVSFRPHIQPPVPNLLNPVPSVPTSLAVASRSPTYMAS